MFHEVLYLIIDTLDDKGSVIGPINGLNAHLPFCISVHGPQESNRQAIKPPQPQDQHKQ